jgi:hypothetical protein
MTMPTAVKSKPKYSLDIYDLDLTDLSFEWRTMDTEFHDVKPGYTKTNRHIRRNYENVLLTYALLTNLETGFHEIAWHGDHSSLFGLHLLGVEPKLTTDRVTNFVFTVSKEVHYFSGDTTYLEKLAYNYHQEFQAKKLQCERVLEKNAKIRSVKRVELFDSEKDYQAYLYGQQVYILYRLSKHKEFKQVLTTNPAVEVWI